MSNTPKKTKRPEVKLAEDSPLASPDFGGESTIVACHGFPDIVLYPGRKIAVSEKHCEELLKNDHVERA